MKKLDVDVKENDASRKENKNNFLKRYLIPQCMDFVKVSHPSHFLVKVFPPPPILTHRLIPVIRSYRYQEPCKISMMKLFLKIFNGPYFKCAYFKISMK